MRRFWLESPPGLRGLQRVKRGGGVFRRPRDAISTLSKLGLINLFDSGSVKAGYSMLDDDAWVKVAYARARPVDMIRCLRLRPEIHLQIGSQRGEESLLAANWPPRSCPRKPLRARPLDDRRCASDVPGFVKRRETVD
jgi:hypothetical protein